MVESAEYIRALRDRLAEYQKAIDKDRLEVRKLVEGIEGKEEQVLYIKKLLAAEGVNLAGEGIALGPEVTVADIAYDALKSIGKREAIYYKDLADLIFKQGKNIPGKDPAANLIAHIGRDERFQRTGRGMYALKEWGLKPMKSSRRKKKRKRKT